MKKHFFLSFYLFIFLVHTLEAQYRVDYPILENEISTEYMSPDVTDWGHGYSIPSQMETGQFMRALIVLIQFKDDTYPIADWPLNQVPTSWMGTNMIDETVDQNSTNFNLTHYYSTMSINKFKFIGNVVHVITANTSVMPQI